MKRLFLVSMFFVVCLSPLFSQTNSTNLTPTNRSITGVVREAATKQPLSGARVMLRGTVLGAITGADGAFRVQIPANTSSQAVLEVFYVGFKTKFIRLDSFAEQSPEAAQNGTSPKEILLDLDPARTDAVVVTAIGIEKAQKTLGYAVSELQGQEFSEARETNISAALVGKVAGAQVNINTGAVGSSTRVILRGVKLLGAYQNNQPLYVVDGIPIDNASGSQPGKYGGVDWGDGIQHINPDDVASMSILRGAAASALYGSRAQNGVILITTKKGTIGGSRNGVGIEYNGNLSFETPLILPDLQNEYGHGYGGFTPATRADALDAGTVSWGSKMTGQMVEFFDGVRRPLLPQPNTIANFYQTGRTLTNTVALSGGTEAATVRFSASNMDNSGMIPNSFLNRSTFTLTGGALLGDRIKLEAKVNYVNESSNRTALADLANPGRSFMYMARSISNEMIRSHRAANGEVVSFTSDAYNPNPYFLINEHFARQSVERLIASALVRYTITDELTLQVRAGRDALARNNAFIESTGTPYNPTGAIYDSRSSSEEINADALLTYTKSLAEKTSLTFTLGGNAMNSRFEGNYVNGYEFILPNIVNVGNVKNRDVYYDLSRKRILSVFGTAQLAHDNWLFAEVTVRNDWSSTLPALNNSYFYPSVNTSIILSELMRLPEAISFAKLRASYALVGSDTDPYQLTQTYGIDQTAHQPRGSITIARASSFVIPLSSLRPTRSNTLELGIDARFAENRLGIDVTWYSQRVFDQILPTDVSYTTGFRQAIINVGEMRNDGIEIVLTATPLAGRLPSELRWDMSANLARNWNLVASLSPGLETLLLEEGRNLANVVATVNQPYGVLQGTGFRRDAQGRILHNENGVPLLTNDYIPLGNSTPTLLGGFTNTFAWQNFTLSALIDFRFGGQMFSYSNAVQTDVGNHKQTLKGREEGVLSEGVLENGQTNTKRLRASAYYPVIAQAAEPFIYDASFVKLREVRLGYVVPEEQIASAFGGIVRGLAVSLVARNVAFLLNFVPGIDPQTSYTNANGQGLEMGAYPTARSVGVNVNLKF